MLTRAGSNGRIFFGAVCLLYVCIVLIAQMSFVVDPSYFHEEQRPLFRYYQVHDPDLFSDDYLASFIGAFPQPYLYQWTTRFWLWAGGDLVVLHRLLPLVCWLAFLAGIAVAARHLGDRLTMLGAVGIAAAQPVYLFQITAASPHAFAFPLLIWGIVAMLHGSIRGLVLVTLLSGLLYTAMAPLLGLLLAWHIFVAQRFLSRQDSDQLKALILLAITGALSLWLLLGSLSSTENFGTVLEPMQQTDVYPENGPEGRHFYGVFNPLLYVAGKATGQFRMSSPLLSLLVLLVYCSVGIYGLLALPKGGAARKALLGFVLCGAAVCLVISLLKPFHSYRFVLYPAFTLLPLLFVVGLQQFCLRLKRVVRFPNVVAIGLLALFALSLDSFDPKKLGYLWHLGPEPRQVMAFAAEQPPGTLFAVWPGADRELELIPYIARRPLFVMYKAHYPTHEDHILAMRARMDALIDAYFATEEAALRTLNCRWGVDYLVVDKAHFAQEDSRPRYFAPFDARVEEIWRGNRRENFLLRAPEPKWVAVETEGHFVLRLDALAGEERGESAAGC